MALIALSVSGTRATLPNAEGGEDASGTRVLAPRVAPPLRGEPPDSDRKNRRPNVLVFLTDDQRAGISEIMPQTKQHIADKGVNFTNAYVTTPLCCPSRVSIMSGRYAHNHGVTSNSIKDKNLDFSSTIQHDLRAVGYRTAFVGKYLSGWNASKAPPDFDEFALLVLPGSRFGDGASYYDTRFNINGDMRTVKRYATDFMSARAHKILGRFEESDRLPWLMYVSTFAPHTPAVPARRHARASVPGLGGNPAIRERNRRDKAPAVRKAKTSMSEMRALARRQQRTLLAVDELIAGLLKRLKRSNELRNTLIVFTSDNGYIWGEHGLSTKRWPYTPSIKVPLMMRWSGRLQAGTKDHRLVANIDIAPTIYDAANIRPEHVFDGQSLLERDQRRSLLLELWEKKPWRALRTHRYQYIEYLELDGHGTPYRELYDLRKDPWQLSNLLWHGRQRHRDIASRLRDKLSQKVECAGEECF